MATDRQDTVVDPLIGRVIAEKIELRELVGVGGMGRVYRGHHATLDKQVAVKVLTPDPGRKGEQIGRFEREARAASRLDHPHCVQIHDFGQDGPDHLLFLAMEFLDGEELQRVVSRHGHLPPVRACKIMIQVLSVLAAAHKLGIVHRDLKPGNIMLLKREDDRGVVQDFVKVCDFGLVRFLTVEDPGLTPSGSRLTLQGTILGTPAYMSPEQASGDEADARSDIYSCGVILYEMLAGRLPFRDGPSLKVLMAHVSEEPEPLSTLVPNLDEDLENAVAWAMNKDPAHRAQTADELRQVLYSYVEAKTDSHPSIRVSAAPPRAIKDRVKKRPSVAEDRPTEVVLPTPNTVVLAPGTAATRPARKLVRSLLIALPVLVLLAAGASLGHTTWMRKQEIATIRRVLTQDDTAAGSVQFALARELPLLTTGDEEAVGALVAECMSTWRAKTREKIPTNYDPSYAIAPSKWKATLRREEDPPQSVVFTFERVGRYDLYGTATSLEAGGTVAIRGIHHEGHAMFYVYDIVAGNPRATFEERINVYFGQDKMVGEFSESHVPIVAVLEK